MMAGFKVLRRKRKIDRAQIDQEISSVESRHPDKSAHSEKTFLHLILIRKTYVVGTQKNRLNETVLLSTPKHMLNIGEKNISIYAYKIA